MADRIDEEGFYMGLLMALSAAGFLVFSTWGDAFHRRFVATVTLAQQTAPVPVEDIDWMSGIDRAFGTSTYAERMIAFGMSARLLTLDSPDLVTARLRPPVDSIRDRIGHRDWFDSLAATFRGDRG